MSKRRSSNRRSSRSSRYTGSAILDPDTDVLDNAHPYWWKNLENNTTGRPSTDFNMLNETSRQLDSNSQIVKETEDEWWNVLDTSDSPMVVKQNTKQDGAKSILSTSESEEEPKIVKRKLPLRSRTKTHQDNAFFNALNESKETFSSDLNESKEVTMSGKLSSLHKSGFNNKTVTNKEQVAEASDSSLNLSLNFDTVLKSKPKIFKKNYKDRDKNMFIDVLQNNEFKVPFKKRSFNIKSPKIMEQKNSSRVEAPLNNQSGSMEYTLSFEGSHDLSHLPAPKAQSTTLEDSTTHNSNKSGSTSDTEHRIVKPKPKLLQRRSRGTKKNVFQDIFENETADEETEKIKSTNENVVENSEIPKRSTRSSSNNLSKISQESPKDINEENDETAENEMSRTRTKRKSAVIAIKNIRISNIYDFLDKDNVTYSDISIALKKKNRTEVTNSQSKISDSPKRKSTRERSSLSQNLLDDKNDERTSNTNKRNETQLPAYVSVDSANEEISNKLQRKSADNILSSLNRKEHSNTESRSRVSNRASNLASSSNKIMNMNSSTSDIDDENEMEIEDEALYDPNSEETSNKLQYSDKKQKSVSEGRSASNVLSSFNSSGRRNTEKRSRISSRGSNLVLTTKEVTQSNIRVSTVGDKDIEDEEDKVLNDTDNEETLHKSQHTDKGQQRVSRKRSPVNISFSPNKEERRETENRSRVSTRASNLASPSNKIMNMNSSTSDIGDENEMEVEDEALYDPDSEETSNKLQYSGKKQRSVSERRSAINISSSFNKKESKKTENRVSSRISNLALSMKESTKTNTRASNVSDKGIEDKEDKVLNDTDNEETLHKSQHTDKGQQRVSQRRSAVNISFSSNKEERRETENHSRVSTRAGNLASPSNKIMNMNSSTSDIGDENEMEVEDEALYDPDSEEASNKLQYSDKKQRSVSERRSAKTGRRNTENRSRISSRGSNLVLSTKEITQPNIRVSRVNDKSARETEDEVPTDVNVEEVPNAQYADKEQKNISQSSTINNLSPSNRTGRRNTENRSRISSRGSNLVLSMKEITQPNIRVSGVDDKSVRETEDEVPTDVNVEEVPNAQYAEKKRKNISQRSTANNSSSSDEDQRKDTESRAGYLAPWLNRVVDMDSSFVDKFFLRGEDETSSDSDNIGKQRNIFKRRSVARISNSGNKEDSDTDKGGTLSIASNNLRSSSKEINQMNKNTLDVVDKNMQETEEEIFNAETPKKSRQPERNTNMFQRMSAANISSTLSGKKSVGAKNRKTGNTLPSFVGTSTMQGMFKSRLQTTIRNFFSADRSPQVPQKQLFANVQNGEKIKSELETIKKEEMDRMNAIAKKQTELLSTVGKKTNVRKKVSEARRNKTTAKQVHKAYLVNGQVYKVPRLPRPKAWVTDRLYKYLWKCMEPKYKLETRIVSEKFVRQLSEVTSSIAKQKSYNNYRGELSALMREMARLGIIRTRYDFYNFCQDFFPYELRVKMVPILLPGNKKNIPYDPSKLHEPLFDESR